MIKYNLTCKDCETSFDSWFSSSKEYERLKKISFLNCYSCNSLNIEKSLMSPNIFKSKNSYIINFLKVVLGHWYLRKLYPNRIE